MRTGGPSVASRPAGPNDEGRGRSPDRPPGELRRAPGRSDPVRHGWSLSDSWRRLPCGAALYDVAAFDDAARWLREHLDAAHGIVFVEVDLRRIVHRQSASWERRAGEVVAQLAICWGDAGATPLVVRAA
jgi:hypothetical protein